MIVEGTLLEWRNKTETPVNISYASVTARELVRCVVSLDDEIIDIVYAGAGGSHSWWSGSGGKLIPDYKFPSGIPCGATLRMNCDKVAAMRIDLFR